MYLSGKKIYLDNNYAPEVLRKRREYTEAKAALKERNIKFQTVFPAQLGVFYEDSTWFTVQLRRLQQIWQRVSYR